MPGGDLGRKVTPVGDIGDHHPRALGRQRVGIVPADALGAAGDDGRTSGQSGHGTGLRLSFRVQASDERLEARELLLDQVDGGRIGERERLLVELLRREGHDHFGLAEEQSVDRKQNLPQMILHARATEDSSGGRLQRHRLLLERLVLHARDPVNRVLEAAGDRPVVLRRNDDHAVSAAYGIGPGGGGGRKARRLLNVEIVDRKLRERRRIAELDSGWRKPREHPRQRRVVGALAQRAADHEHVELSVGHGWFSGAAISWRRRAR